MTLHPIQDQESASTESTESTRIHPHLLHNWHLWHRPHGRKDFHRTSQTQVAKTSGKYHVTLFCKASACLEQSAPSLALESSPAQASKQTNPTARAGPRPSGTHTPTPGSRHWSFAEALLVRSVIGTWKIATFQTAIRASFDLARIHLASEVG